MEKKKIMDFVVDKRGFRIYYKGKSHFNDNYWLYFIDNKKERLLIKVREDECILLSAILSFTVHKVLVEVKKIGCEKSE